MYLTESKKMIIHKILLFATAVAIIFAATALTGISATGTDLFTVGQSAATTFIEKITNLYCQSLFPLIMIIDLAWLALTHDDKTTGKLITAMKWACAGYVLIKGVSWISSTLDLIK